MAFVFAGKGIAELQEGRIVGTTVIPSLAWLRVPVLGIYPTVQSLVAQGVLVLCAVVAVYRAFVKVAGTVAPAGAPPRSRARM
jgi:high-affinity iron transporter